MQNLITDKKAALATISAQGTNFDLSTLCHTLCDDEQVVRLALISDYTNLQHASKRLQRDATTKRLANHLRNLSTFVTLATFKESNRPAKYPLYMRAFVFQQERLSDTKLFDPITTEAFFYYHEAQEHYERATHLASRDDDRYPQSKALYEARICFSTAAEFDSFFDDNEIGNTNDLADAIMLNAPTMETDSYEEFAYTAEASETTFDETQCDKIVIEIN